MWNELQSVLQEEIKLHRKLKETLGSLREAIVLRDSVKLEEILEFQSELGKEIQNLENKRVALCRKLIQQEGVIRLSELVEYAPKSMRKVFVRLRNEMISLLEQIQREVRVMRYVVRTVLGYVEEMISIFTAGELMAYDSTGSKVRSKGYIYSASA